MKTLVLEKKVKEKRNKAKQRSNNNYYYNDKTETSNYNDINILSFLKWEIGE